MALADERDKNLLPLTVLEEAMRELLFGIASKTRPDIDLGGLMKEIESLIAYNKANPPTTYYKSIINSTPIKQPEIKITIIGGADPANASRSSLYKTSLEVAYSDNESDGNINNVATSLLNINFQFPKLLLKEWNTFKGSPMAPAMVTSSNDECFSRIPKMTFRFYTDGNDRIIIINFDNAGNVPDSRAVLAIGCRDGKFAYWNSPDEVIEIYGLENVKVIEDTEDYTIYSDNTDCTFTVRKDTGELYLGEEYENICNENFGNQHGFTKIDDKYVITTDPFGANYWINFSNVTFSAAAGETVKLSEEHIIEFSPKLKEKMDIDNCLTYPFGGSADNVSNKNVHVTNKSVNGNILKFSFVKDVTFVNDTTDLRGAYSHLVMNLTASPQVPDITNGDYWFRIIKTQITKTASLKPYVKKKCPSSRIYLKSDCSTKTHSYIMKNVKNADSEGTWVLGKNVTSNNSKEEIVVERTTKNFDLMLSDSEKMYIDRENGTEGPVLVNKKYTNTQHLFAICNHVQAVMRRPDTCSQLIIYRGDLSKEELRVENNKHIVISDKNKGAFPTEVGAKVDISKIFRRPLEISNTTDFLKRLRTVCCTLNGELMSNVKLEFCETGTPTGVPSTATLDFARDVNSRPFIGQQHVEDVDKIVRSTDIRWISSVTQDQFDNIPPADGSGNRLILVRGNEE